MGIHLFVFLGRFTSWHLLSFDKIRSKTHKSFEHYWEANLVKIKSWFASVAKLKWDQLGVEENNGVAFSIWSTMHVMARTIKSSRIEK